MGHARKGERELPSDLLAHHVSRPGTGANARLASSALKQNSSHTPIHLPITIAWFFLPSHLVLEEVQVDAWRNDVRAKQGVDLFHETHELGSLLICNKVGCR